MTRIVPEGYDDDTVFCFASRVVYHRDADRWDIQVDPEHCLAGAVGPAVSEIQAETPSIAEREDCVVYDGRILFSAGVVFVVNDMHVLLERGPNAPTAPGKWTSPAGRCEHDPGTTALKEFYEELALTVRDRPAFVRWGDRSATHVDTYRETLQRVGYDTPRAEWHDLDATVSDSLAASLSDVTTTYRDHQSRDEMLAYYDSATNTLELRFVLRVALPAETVESLSLHDGEFDRRVALFDRQTLQQLPPSTLVATDRYLVTELLPDAVSES